MFGCNVTCLEKDTKYALISRRVLNRLKLNDRIKVVNGSIGDVDLKGFDKVFVAVLAFPKSRILKSLERSDADVVVRTAFGSSVLAYAPLEKQLLDNFTIKGHLIRWGKNFASSIFIRPK